MKDFRILRTAVAQHMVLVTAETAQEAMAIAKAGDVVWKEHKEVGITYAVIYDRTGEDPKKKG